MITIKHPVDLPDTYPLDRIGPLKDLLFFDIETTGFSGDTSQLYLIGCTYHEMCIRDRASTSADRLFQPYTEASMPKGRDVF